MCCTSSPEVERMEALAEAEILLQQVSQGKQGQDIQGGAPIHPNGSKETCLTAKADDGVGISQCDGKKNQQWFYDRAGGGALKTLVEKDGREKTVCLTREDGSLLARKCANDEEVLALQQWKFRCGAITNGQSGSGGVLQEIGTKVITSPWSGKKDQLWDFTESVEHSKCQDRKLKVLKFDGSLKTVARVKSLISMPEKELTVAAWINSKAGTPLSYGTKEAPDMFVISNVQSLQVYLLGEVIETGIAVAGLGWVHVAVTWTSEIGELKVYLNGYPRFKKVVALGKSIIPGGCFMVGQQQGAQCAATAGNSFEGEISDIQVLAQELKGPQIKDIMTKPVHQDVVDQVRSAPESIRLALLTRQYAAEELDVGTPRLCDLEAFRDGAKPLEGPTGFMEFSLSGGGHYNNFDSCHFQAQIVGEMLAVKVKPDWFEAAPLTIQYRTTAVFTNCAWCKNGAMSYVDGCAVKYGDDQASIGFGGIDEEQQYEPHATMNGQTHEGWKYSASKRMQVNFGTAEQNKKTFEARINDGTYVKCAPRSMYIVLPAKYKGKIQGVGAGWESGPNTEVCSDCKSGEPVTGTAGICHKDYKLGLADPFNGNSLGKPISKFVQSWQVNGAAIPSVFSYPRGREVNGFNHNTDEAIKPPLTLKPNKEGAAKAATACGIFGNETDAFAKCTYDFSMIGENAVKQTKEDLEREKESHIIVPTQSSVRDMSKYRSDAHWEGSASWSCADDLTTRIADYESSKLQNTRNIFMRPEPVFGSHVIVYLNVHDAQAEGLSRGGVGVLDFAEIKVYGSGGQVNFQDVQLSSIQESNGKNFAAKNCVDAKPDTDCRTAETTVATFTGTLATRQEIRKIELADTQDKDAPARRNLGAVVMITDAPNTQNPVWQSDAIKEHQQAYTFEPKLKFQYSNLTGTAAQEINTWDFTSPFTKLETNSITIPGDNMIRTRRKYDPSKYSFIKAEVQKLGQGKAELVLFSPKCSSSTGAGVILGHEGNKVFARVKTALFPTSNATAEATQLNSIAIETDPAEDVITIFVNGQQVHVAAIPEGSPVSEICFTSPGGALVVKNVELKQVAPVGLSQIHAARVADAKFKEAAASKIDKFKKKYYSALMETRKAVQEKREKATVAAQEKETKEVENKADRKKEMDAKKKQEAIACEERKVKAAEEKARNDEIRRVTANRDQLREKYAGLKQTIKDDVATYEQQKVNIVKAKQSIAKVAATLGAAQANVTSAFVAAKNSLVMYKAHLDTNEKEVGGGLTSEHDDYLKKAAHLRALHQTRADMINLLHESKIRMNDLEVKAKEDRVKAKELKMELQQAQQLLTSMLPEEKVEQEEAEEAAKEEEAAQAPPPPPPKRLTYGEMIENLKTTADADKAFDMVMTLTDRAKAAKSGGQAAEIKLKNELADAEINLAKYQDEVGTLTTQDKAEMSAALKKAEEELAQAEDSGNAQEISKAKSAVVQAIEAPASTSAEEHKIEILKSDLAAAQKVGDKPKIEAAEKLLTAAQRALDPSSLEGQVEAIKSALEKAREDCHYNENDPKVLSLKEMLTKKEAQARAEADARVVDAMVAAAASAKSVAPAAEAEGAAPAAEGAAPAAEGAAPAASEDKKKPAPVGEPKPKPAEPNALLVEAQTKMADAQDKGDEKQVAQLEKKVAQIKKDEQAAQPEPIEENPAQPQEPKL